jgi:hypothetical protein
MPAENKIKVKLTLELKLVNIPVVHKNVAALNVPVEEVLLVAIIQTIK